MSQQQNKVNEKLDDVIVAPDMLDLDRRLKVLQLSKLEEETKKSEDEKDSIERFKVARKAEVELANSRERNMQAACLHRKRDNTANLGGQRDHSGHRHFICLNCNKHWMDQELPMELAQNFDFDRIGGPIS